MRWLLAAWLGLVMAGAAGQARWVEMPALVPLRMLEPATVADATPLVVALHGFGGTAAGFERAVGGLAERGLRVALPQGAYPVIAGRDLGRDWSLNLEEDPALRARAARLALAGLRDLIRDLRRESPQAPVYLLGHSQGAMLALLLALQHPGEVAGVVCFGLPAFDTAWLAATRSGDALRPRVLLLHGDSDRIAAPDVSARAEAALAAAGFSVELRRFRGGHELPARELAAAAQWLRGEQVRP